jgi:(R)-2-hydroxyacyl-CoA dehydratese activating ATPase
VILEEGVIVESYTEPSGSDPLTAATDLLHDAVYDRLIATGYGRHLLELARDLETVTEIKAYAVGARALCPECRTVLDIGGQDMKAIALDADGRVQRFEMNDRCAAGSGKFLEIMAHTLDYPLEEFGSQALAAHGEVTISCMCTVFAESEVTSLLHKGAAREDIALAVHHSVVRRATGMLRRITASAPLLFAGGGAFNPCTRHLLAEALSMEVIVPDTPQLVGALGAARLAATK